MKIFALCALLICAASAATAAPEPERDWSKEKGIGSGVLIPGSMSPNSKFALFEFNFRDGADDLVTTQTAIGLAPADRSKLLSPIDSRTEWQTDKKVTTFLTVRWSPDSTLLATHDSGRKNSHLSLYRVSEGKAVTLKVPDLLPAACTKLGVSPGLISTSGQQPSKWTSTTELEVNVHFTAKGREYSTTIPLQVMPEGTVNVHKP